ncbi:hypothetical protein J4471_00945 [Candidatus Woesearchaeota archaeon]|nr:hypothetical protein [Candidatus Woesearchaeota archaeon]
MNEDQLRNLKILIGSYHIDEYLKWFNSREPTSMDKDLLQVYLGIAYGYFSLAQYNNGLGRIEEVLLLAPEGKRNFINFARLELQIIQKKFIIDDLKDLDVISEKLNWHSLGERCIAFSKSINS